MENKPTTKNTAKRKPEAVLFYNKNKVGVDVMDQMIMMYSTRSATRRWPYLLIYWTSRQ